MHSFRLCVTTLLGALLLAAAPPADAAHVDAHVERALARGGRTEVFVMLRAPAVLSRRDVRARRRMIDERRAPVLAVLPAADVEVLDTLTLVSGFSAMVTPAGLAALRAQPDVLTVDAMQYGSGALAQSVPQIRADAVHNRDDLGQGVTVAVLDTGVDPSHPDLVGSIVGEQCFCSGNCCPDGSSVASGPGSAFTTYVHGIHVTGIIVSKGIVAPEGVAPGAKVVAVKVLNDQNRGSLLDWIRGLEWIATARPDVQAINMSLVSDAVFPDYCDHADDGGFNMAFAQMITLLRSRGVLTFVAAGNTGEVGAMASPACVTGAVAVGAVDKSDEIAAFSDTDSALDLLAPGVEIVSTAPNGGTATLTGTSMATPHATGTAALLLALNPHIGASQLESALKSTGVPLVDARNGLTFPRVDALAAMNAVLSVTPPLLGGGSHVTDCLVEWTFTPFTIAAVGHIPGATCRDNDPLCDADQLSGQCTFRMSLCFNVPDARVPRCSTAAPLVAFTPSWPTSAGDAIDAANAAAIAGALPALPIHDTDRCTANIPFIVPAGETRWVRFAARASDGRSDFDRLRLMCTAN